MNVWERIKKFINKIKGKEPEQLTLDEKNEIKKIVEDSKQANVATLKEVKTKYVKNGNYVANVNGWVGNRLTEEAGNICLNTVLPSTSGVLIEKHRARVQYLFIEAIGEQIGTQNKYESVIGNAREKCIKRLINPYAKEITGKLKTWLKNNNINEKSANANQLEEAFKCVLNESDFVQEMKKRAIEIANKKIVSFELGNYGNVISIEFVANERANLCYNDKAYTKKVTKIQTVNNQSNVIENVMTVVHKVVNGVSEAVLDLVETVDIRNGDGSFYSNVRTETHRKLQTDETPDFIMQKYEKGVYSMDVNDCDYYKRDILAQKDTNIVWKKITTQPGHEYDCKVVIYPDGKIGNDEIKRENITANEVENAWNELKKYVEQDETLAIAE